MARPKSEDPKVVVSLSIRQSTRDHIASRLATGQTVGGVLSAAVENKYRVFPVEERLQAAERRQAENGEVTSRLKGVR